MVYSTDYCLNRRSRRRLPERLAQPPLPRGGDGARGVRARTHQEEERAGVVGGAPQRVAVLLGALHSWLGFKYGMLAVTVAFILVLAYVIPKRKRLASRLESPPEGRAES